MRPKSISDSVCAMTSLIPMGRVTAHGAKAIGFPGAATVVGQARGASPMAVPCRRLVRSDGMLGGYSGGEGPATEAKLPAREGMPVTAGKGRPDQ